MTSLFPQITVIGLTGKIGSGKSEFAKIMEENGAIHIDCDQIVHDLYEPEKNGAKKIRTFFGDQYLLKSGAVNRNKLLKTLFKTPKKWAILNRMIHPLVAEELKRRLRKIKTGIVILEIQIYDEKLFGKFMDERWVIESNDDKRVRRLKNRDLTREQIMQISVLNPAIHGEFQTIDNNHCRKTLRKIARERLKELEQNLIMRTTCPTTKRSSA